MGKGALRPFFKGHSLKKEKEHEKKEVDKMLSHFVTLPFHAFSESGESGREHGLPLTEGVSCPCARYGNAAGRVEISSNNVDSMQLNNRG